MSEVYFRKDKGIWTKEDYEILTGEIGALLREKEYNFFKFLRDKALLPQCQTSFQNFILLQKQGALKLEHKKLMLEHIDKALDKYLEKQDEVIKAYAQIGGIAVIDSALYNEATMTKQLALKLGILASLGLVYLDLRAKTDELLEIKKRVIDTPLLRVDELPEFAFILD